MTGDTGDLVPVCAVYKPCDCPVKAERHCANCCHAKAEHVGDQQAAKPGRWAGFVSGLSKALGEAFGGR